jgi:hypothetical protein
VRGRERVKTIFTIEAEKFNEVMKRWLVTTSRELSVAVNARMAFLLMRMFVLIPPHRVQQKRDEIRTYFHQPIGDRRKDKKTGKAVGRARQLRRVHLIAQARNAKAGKPGLYGEDMAKAAASLRRKAVGSVGYLKSGLIGAIRKFQGHFTQFGGSTKKSGGKQISGNAAFMRLVDQYGGMQGTGNVAKHRGAKFEVWTAKPGLSGSKTEAWMQLSIGIADDQVQKVDAIYATAATRAFRDEREEMERHLAEKLAVAADAAIKAA